MKLAIIVPQYGMRKIFQRMGKDLLASNMKYFFNVNRIGDAIKRIVTEINLQRDETERLPVFATRCIEAGILPKTVQKYLGHANLQMTMDLYVHITEEFKKEEFKKLEEIYKLVL